MLVPWKILRTYLMDGPKLVLSLEYHFFDFALKSPIKTVRIVLLIMHQDLILNLI